jgi:uncharacterized membrane protein
MLSQETSSNHHISVIAEEKRIMQNPPVQTGPGDVNAKTALGLDANLGAAIGYPIGLLAIIIFVMEKENRFARFHALQSILYHVAWVVIFIGVGIVLAIVIAVLGLISSALATILGGLLSLVFLLAGLVWFVGTLFLAYKAYGGASMKLPIVGGMTDKILNK